MTDKMGAGDSAFESDVIRQLSVLKKIEDIWRNEDISRDRIVEIYCEVYGVAAKNFSWRTSAVQLADEMITPVEPSKIQQELKHLDRALARVMGVYAYDPYSKKLAAAAAVFCEIIRIHPFRDGNGRTARLVLNLLMRRWGDRYIAVPKVRNDAKWLAAMKLGIAGDVDAVCSSMTRWVVSDPS